MLCKVDGKIAVVETASWSGGSRTSERRATNNCNNLRRHHIRCYVDLIVIPHLATLLPQIEVMRAPSSRTITGIGKWKGPPNDEHLATVDDIAYHGIVWISNSGSLPPLDPRK
jgi:hypothetical protein